MTKTEKLQAAIETLRDLRAALDKGASPKKILDEVNAALAPVGVEVKRQANRDGLVKRLAQVAEVLSAEYEKACEAEYAAGASVPPATRDDVEATMAEEEPELNDGFSGPDESEVERDVEAHAWTTSTPGETVAAAAEAVEAAASAAGKVARAAALLAGTAQPRVAAKAVRAPKAPAEITVGGTTYPTRRLMRTLRRVGVASRSKLAKELGVNTDGMTVRDATRALAAALNGKPELPVVLRDAMELAEAKSAPKGSRPAKEGSRIGFMIGLLRRPQGATVEEIADAMLKQFPTLSPRRGGGPASRDNYVTFARTCIAHLQHGRSFSEAAALKGKVRSDEKREGRTVYKVAG